MKRIALVVGIIASLAVSQVANATTQTFADESYNWATWTAATHDGADAWGYPSIVSTDVTTLQVGQAQQLQNIAFKLNHHDFSVKSGDLFIDANSDMTWDYVVRTLNTSLYKPSSVTRALYALPALDYNSATAQLADYTFSYGHTPLSDIRAGVPIGLASTPTTASLGNVGFSANASAISFDFTGLGNNALNFVSNFTIGYEVSCGNDVVYQEVPVPEPGTMALLGFGLLGMAVYGKRRMNKEA